MKFINWMITTSACLLLASHVQAGFISCGSATITDDYVDASLAVHVISTAAINIEGRQRLDVRPSIYGGEVLHPALQRFG